MIVADPGGVDDPVLSFYLHPFFVSISHAGHTYIAEHDFGGPAAVKRLLPGSILADVKCE